MRENNNNNNKYYPKYAKLSNRGSHLGGRCLAFSEGSAVLFTTCFSGPLRGTPWTDVGLLWCTLGPILFTFKDFRSNKRHIFQIPAQRMAQITPSKKQARIQRDFTDNQSKQIMFYFCCCFFFKRKKSKSEAPGNKIGSAELPKG